MTTDPIRSKTPLNLPRSALLAAASFVITAASYSLTYEATTDAQLAAVPWLSLTAGDEVRIHWKAEPYRVKIAIRGRGTEAAPIKITGVVGPAGELPALSGADAITPPQFTNYNGGVGFFSVYTEGLTAFLIRRASNDTYGYRPGHITIENLRFTGSNEGNSYTNQRGSRVPYPDGVAGLWAVVDHLIVRRCQFDDNGNGFFTQANGDEDSITRNVLFEYNRVFNNGNIWNPQRRDREHNIYAQAGTSMIFQYNYIGPVRVGTAGSSLKDRSANLVVRYNWIVSSARALDIVEPEGSFPILSTEPGYHETFVYGNVIVDNLDNDPHSTSVIHYGADGVASAAKMGPHHFYNNTVVVTGSGAVKEYRVSLFDLGTNSNGDIAINNAIVADIRNNILYWNPGVISPYGEMALLRYFGTANLEGTNWISTGWRDGRTGFVGTVNRNGTLITGTAPGFADEAAGVFSLPTGGPAVDQASALPATLHPLLGMYKRDAAGVARAIVGTAMDLGAFEGPDAGRPEPDQPTTYTAWRSANFTGSDLTDDAISGPLADPDGAGVTNLQRYAHNLSARGPVANPVTLDTTGTGATSHLSLTFNTRTGATDLSYLVESSSDLATWTLLATYAPSTSNPITAEDDVPLSDPDTPRRFLRLRLTSP